MGARQALARAVADSGLAALPIDRLATLAADASRKAARSARLELYPHGMDASRVLALCRAAIVGERDGITEEQPAQRGATRGAADRAAGRSTPAANTRSAGGVGVRRRPAHRRAATGLAGVHGGSEPGAAKAPTVATRVVERVEVLARSLDTELLAELDALVIERRINPAVITGADREGPSGRDWARLSKLMGDAADRVAARLGKEVAPVVLGDLGLAARFGLGALLQALLDASRRDDGPAVLLVVPRFGARLVASAAAR